MEVYLEHPAFLWILLGIVPLVIWAAVVSYALAPPWKRITSTLLRIVALALLVLAISRPVWRLQRPDQTVARAQLAAVAVARDRDDAILDRHRYALDQRLADPALRPIGDEHAVGDRHLDPGGECYRHSSYTRHHSAPTRSRRESHRRYPALARPCR